MFMSHCKILSGFEYPIKSAGLSLAVGEHRIDCLEGLSKAMARQAQVGSLPTHSTISRYACRIQIDRDEPHRAFLYASAFDGCRNIMFSVIFDFLLLMHLHFS